MARSLKTLNTLAGYLVWSESAWGGVGEAQNTRQAFSPDSHLPIGWCRPEGVKPITVVHEIHHLHAASCMRARVPSTVYSVLGLNLSS